MSGSWVVASAEATLSGEVCVAASTSRVGWAAGAEEEQSRGCTRNESCAAASASEADITSPVTSRVRPTGKCEIMELSGGCGLGAGPEGAVPFDCLCEGHGLCSQRGGRTRLYCEGDVVLRATYPCSRSDSTMWCHGAVAHSAVLPSEN